MCRDDGHAPAPPQSGPLVLTLAGAPRRRCLRILATDHGAPSGGAASVCRQDEGEDEYHSS
jgi:hypothetical protein